MTDSDTASAEQWIAPMPMSTFDSLTADDIVEYALEDGVIIDGGVSAVSDAIAARRVA